jgi:two-component system, LytTR family, sensor kinase
MSKAGSIDSLKTNALLYIISLILYVLVSELIYSLMGFLFFTQNLLNNMLHAGASLGLMFIFSLYAKKQLDVLNPWFDNPIKRFKKQSLLNAWLIPLVVTGLFVYVSFIKVHFLQSDMYIQYRLMVINYFIFAFIMQLNVAFDLGSYFLQQWQDSKIQQATFDKEKAQFNLELLRNQVNPHFLFNNLNTLSALIYEDQDKAAGFLRMLSKVYRNILEYKNKETVSLSDELQFFDTYWQLLQIRFKDMIQVFIRVDPNLHHKKMIPLTLQLLIENAIKHNVVSMQNPLLITIESQKDMLIVSNPIIKKESLDYSSGLGLKIISNRYAYLSEKPFEVINDGTHFTLKIPLL